MNPSRDHGLGTSPYAARAAAHRHVAAIRRRLEHALAAWACPRCRANYPRVTATRGRMRYVRCRVCGSTSKLLS